MNLIFYQFKTKKEKTTYNFTLLKNAQRVKREEQHILTHARAAYRHITLMYVYLNEWLICGEHGRYAVTFNTMAIFI